MSSQLISRFGMISSGIGNSSIFFKNAGTISTNMAAVLPISGIIIENSKIITTIIITKLRSIQTGLFNPPSFFTILGFFKSTLSHKRSKLLINTFTINAITAPITNGFAKPNTDFTIPIITSK